MFAKILLLFSNSNTNLKYRKVFFEASVNKCKHLKKYHDLENQFVKIMFHTLLKQVDSIKIAAKPFWKQRILLNVINPYYSF